MFETQLLKFSIRKHLLMFPKNHKIFHVSNLRIKCITSRALRGVLMFKKLIGFIIVFVFMQGSGMPIFGETERIRVGHFPNVTHAPALITHATGHFEKIYGESTKIDWKIFNE